MEQYYTLSKEFYFEAGHRLVKNYVGKCNHPHGHSWRVEVVVKGDQLDKYDMLTDYKNIKVAMSPIIEELDHSFMLCKEDKELVLFFSTQRFRTVVFDDNPTSETIARYIFEELKKRLPHGVEVEEVIINETCTSKCSYKNKSGIF